MHTPTTRFSALASLVALAIVVLSSCGAKETPPVKKTHEAAGHFSAQVRTVQKAKSFKVAFDNPIMDQCPVCGEPVDYESFVTIGKRHYALCSNACAERLQDDPGRYLGATSDDSSPAVPQVDRK
jgi:YHS domain-containing protein